MENAVSTLAAACWTTEEKATTATPPATPRSDVEVFRQQLDLAWNELPSTTVKLVAIRLYHVLLKRGISKTEAVVVAAFVTGIHHRTIYRWLRRQSEAAGRQTPASSPPI